MSATETGAIHVTSTQSYRTSDTVYIEDEQITYYDKDATTLKSLGAQLIQRGVNQTKAVAHNVIGTPVYSQEMGTINQATGAFTATTSVQGGTVGAPGFNLGFLIRAIPQVVAWQFPFFTGQLQYLQIILQMVGVGLTVTLVFGGIYAFMGIFK